ncbi:MAG: hydantoinase/oxoprolinase family protein [Propionibacteriales bacterium]|nr:hydantoinase/oxoprolinase family protein [Propionibacteriales bacterium]
MSERSTRYRVTVDTGGTFSDFVVFEEKTGAYRILKVPSTPDDPGRAVLNGLDVLREEGVRPHEITFFSHGTTVATNALIEERGARVGLVITSGFRGIYETMEQSRPYGPAVFDLGYEKPRLLAPASRTAEVTERIGSKGEVRVALDEHSVRDALALLEAEQVESVAICFLFSFMNPDHERRVRESLEAAHPEWWVSTSSELLPQIREYYRLSTVVTNAYVSPVLGRYVQQLEQRLDERGIAPARRFTMQSNGGSSPFHSTASRAVVTILSGPAGGVTAGSALAATAGIDDIITFDMGGTSCDVSLIQGGEPVVTDRSKIGGRDIAVPMLDINTVSAGGGTLAEVDPQGALHVGPQSAGAVPGPACYGRGGELPTVTDANVVLGYLSPGELLGGAMSIDAMAAHKAIDGHVAQPLGIDVVRAADGIVKIVNVKMAQAIKAISTERGFDLRDFTLVPFGGAGPVHACQIALDLGLPKLLIPPAPGANSALGLLMSDVKHDYVRSRLADIAEISADEATALFHELQTAAKAQLEGEGFGHDEMRFRHFLDMRYAGQGYENPVPLDGMPITPDDVGRYRARFDDIHRMCHGHAAPGQPVEVVNYRIEAVGLVPRVELARLEPAEGPPEDAQLGTRSAYFSSPDHPNQSTGLTDVPVYDRDKLRAGHRFSGPALVDQYDATTVVAPGQVVTVDPFGNLLVEAVDTP